MDSNVSQDVNFTAALALHSHRRDQALGLKLSNRTRGLLWFYETKRRELAKGFLKAAFDYGAAQAARQRMTEIVTEAESAALERRLELLQEAQRLQEKLTKIMGQAQAQ